MGGEMQKMMIEHPEQLLSSNAMSISILMARTFFLRNSTG